MSLDTLYVYGDSYSYNQPDNQRTNGPVWSDIVAERWGIQQVNYAEPGATFCKNKQSKSSLHQQVSKVSDNGGVHVIFLGVSDLLAAKGKVKNSHEWIECVHAEVLSLHSREAHIIVMGVPALEFSPYAQYDSKKVLKDNIMNLNVELEESVNDWKEKGVSVEFFDTYLVFSDLLGDPAPIRDVDNAYWDHCVGRCNDAIDDYLWYDTLHVTGAGHKAIANTLLSKEYFEIESLPQEMASPIDHLPSNTTLLWILLAFLLLLGLFFTRHHPYVLMIRKKIGLHPSKAHTNRNVEYAPV